MKKLKYALIGCGRISKNHITAAINNGDSLQIAAVCDIILQNAENILKFIGEASEGTKVYIDYKKMLDEVKPDLCVVATESGKHAEIALDCIAAGCNVIIEKPMALSIADADKIIKASEEKGIVLCVCHQNRFNKSVIEIRKALEAGRFGRLLHGTAHILWARGKNYYEQAPWRGTWEQDGGALMNQCIHNIDLLCWMMDSEPEEVFAYTDRLKHDYIEAEDLGLAVVKFKNGAYGVIEGTTNVFPENLEETLYLFGEKGTVKAGGKSVNTIEEWRFADNADNVDEIIARCGENTPNVYGYGHTPLYKDVISAIINGTELCVDAYAGKRAVEMILAIYKSAAEGKPVKFPLKDCSTIDFKGRF